MILVHGGAGQLTPDRHDRLRAGVRAAAAAGRAVLDRGGVALDAVVAAVRLLEDDPEFGAGLGSALTRDGTVETCASVMDGRRRRAGAVAAAPDLGMPVIVARAVMEQGEHVILAGAAAQRYAAEIGLAPAAPGALITPRAHAQLHELARAGGTAAAQAALGEGGGVGAVARDRQGGFAAATSAGGTIYRRPGCIDDSCVPGVGTWADEEVAVSTSGGEALFRTALAHDIARRVGDGTGLRVAVKEAFARLREVAPTGAAGAIVVSRDAWVALQLGPAMPVAWIDDFGPGDALGFPA
ncbi:MAG: isoaspartyl peptidase/L-asparaginase [Kofleriaceae bacterium]|nr:isoaspartyl peptidase/L-asparaginase [Kofleriaceae bacterium]MBP9202866.1 isoaspartyl peptidase/L-asparaginase [Kofleriaceae bacterium]